jgi:hypothetical protein
MRAPSISPRRFRRQLIVTLAMIGLVSAAILMPGVVGAALKFSRPAIPAAGETLATYSATGSNNVSDHGGSVIKNPKVFLIFEGNWAASDIQYVKQYFTDVSGSALEGILSQYDGISNTISVSGSVQQTSGFYDSGICGNNSIFDSNLVPVYPTLPDDIYSELEAETNGTADGSTIYYVFIPPGYSLYWGDCNTQQCSYHSNTLWNYAVVSYGLPYCNTGGSDLDAVINMTSHEQFEAITNQSSLTHPSGGGWYETIDNCGTSTNPQYFCEIGDKCGDAHPGIYLNGHFYEDVQGEYSNATGYCEYTTFPPTPTPTPTNTPVPTCSVTNETDNIQPSNGTNPYVDNRGNTWYVYYDIKRDAKTNAPCQMQLVVRIFNPAPNGAWSGTASLYTLVNGNYDSASFGKVSGSCTYQAHFVWRGPWFKAGSAYYHLETFEYNGSNAYTRAWANFSI